MALDNVAVVIAHYLQGAVGVDVETAAEMVYGQLAGVISSDGVILDLADPESLENLIVDMTAFLVRLISMPTRRRWQPCLPPSTPRPLT